jgi:hypothetical protein
MGEKRKRLRRGGREYEIEVDELEDPSVAQRIAGEKNMVWTWDHQRKCFMVIRMVHEEVA